MSYKTLLSSLAAIVGIALAIVGLSIEHRHQLESIAAGESSTVVTPKLPARSDQSVVVGGHCNIERIDSNLFAESASRERVLPIQLSGWIVDPVTKSIPKDAGIRIEQRATRQVWIVPLSVNINRTDVVANEGNEQAYLRSGFSVRFNPAKLPVGDYRLLIQYESGKTTYVCDNGRQLKIKG